jgi:hypothetical protein
MKNHPEFGTRQDIIARVYAAIAQPVAPMTDADRKHMWLYKRLWEHGPLNADPDEVTEITEE